jgi:hypothetical protein
VDSPTRPRRQKHLSRERRLRGGRGGPVHGHPRLALYISPIHSTRPARAADGGVADALPASLPSVMANWMVIGFFVASLNVPARPRWLALCSLPHRNASQTSPDVIRDQGYEDSDDCDDQVGELNTLRQRAPP